MEKHECEYMILETRQKLVFTNGRQCRRAGVILSADGKWYCATHATKILNTPGSKDNEALNARMNNKKPPSNCKLESCKYNRIPPSENSQECFACEGNKDPNWDYKN